MKICLHSTEQKAALGSNNPNLCLNLLLQTMQRRTLTTFVLQAARPFFTLAWPVPPGITFDKGLIPKLHAPLPILSLGDPATIPDDLLQQFVHAVAPNTTVVTDYETGGKQAYDGDRLIAFYDAGSGETRVFPLISRLSPTDGPIHTDPVHSFIHNGQMFPKDHTIILIASGSSLFGSTSKKHQNSTNPQLFMSNVAVQRNISSSGHN
jgi:hypothetical protein